MTKNVGKTDRTLRIVGALAIGILYLAGVLSGTMALLLGIVAVVLLATGIAGFCPAYLLLRRRTRAV